MGENISVLLAWLDGEYVKPFERHNFFPEVITFLISAGAQLSAKGEDGRIPLHLAVEWGTIETVKAFCEPLLRFGIGKPFDRWLGAQKLLSLLKEKTFEDKTVLDTAIAKQKADVVNYLEEIKTEAEKVKNPFFQDLQKKSDTTFVWK